MLKPERRPAGRPTGGQFAARTRGDGLGLTPKYPAEGTPEWALGEVSHWASPVIGWIRLYAHRGDNGALPGHEQSLRERLKKAAESIRPDRAEEATDLLVARMLPFARQCAADPERDPSRELDELCRAAAAELLYL